jgi:hypothetical protein
MRTRRVSPHQAAAALRRRLQNATIPYLVRLNLFALGFQYIQITGEVASREEAPIVVCNHQARVQHEHAVCLAAQAHHQSRVAGLSGHLALPVALPPGWRVGC